MEDIREIFILSKNKHLFNFAVKVKAGAKNNAIDGVICVNNVWHLKLSIKAIPENGKANISIVDFLAKTWKVPKGSIKLIRGNSSNYKVFSLLIDDISAIPHRAIF